MPRTVIVFALSLLLPGLFEFVNTSAILYRNPPKYWHYKSYPPLYVYPKMKYHHPSDALKEFYVYRLSAPDKNPLKYTKHIRPVDKLRSGLVSGDHILLNDDKKYALNGWLTDAEHVKFTEPVFGFGGSSPHYYTGGQQHQHHHHQDIKPVMEHIENDLIYDFRTKTHSYGR